eukprot:TRINITY_DN120_c0_g1_i3.p1 TRINITY_DN120_c0_g1~~TRINITY_DN120_c0_g1_i3.p1  ORF type:complete len:271 (+),score=73.86 TRINITY_DN120_c0_g1_i3:72-884(+)
MMLQLLLVALASTALADPQAPDPALRGGAAEPPATKTAETAETADDDDSYIERDLVKDEGKTLADVKSVDLKTCALFCDTLPSCKSFSYTSQDDGKCYLKSKIVKAADEAAQEQKGFRSYYKDKQVQEAKGESESKESEAKESALAAEEQEGGTADEEVPTADLEKVYNDMEGISSTWGNFIVCRGGRVCRGGWYRGRCRGGFYCRGGGGYGRGRYYGRRGYYGHGGYYGRRGYYGRGRLGGGGCRGVRVCRGGWRGGVCRGGFSCRRYR